MTYIFRDETTTAHQSTRPVRYGLFLAAIAAALFLIADGTSASAQGKKNQGKRKQGKWNLTIVPATKTPSPQADPLGKVKTHVAGATYADIYRSIPFIRSEYDANPSYRHEATMRILFGQLFPDGCCRGVK